MSQCNGHDQAAVFVSPPPGVDWPQAAGPAAQTSARTDDVHWAALETMEDASTRAAGKRPAANKRRQAIFPLSDDEAEDADIFRLVPQKRRRQLEPMDQGGSSVPVGPTSPTTKVQRTSGKGVEHQALAPVLVVEGNQVAPTEHAEQARPKRCTFATSFRASKL